MIKRIYDVLLEDHFSKNRQMVFLSGPRQVGKTTASRSSEKQIVYINWDNQADKKSLLKGPDEIILKHELDQISRFDQRIVFDEIHKYSKWKNFVKGFYDSYGKNFDVVVTGSARLNIFKKGGDSLMGRYFPYRMHPLSIAELASPMQIDSEIKNPCRVSPGIMDQLITFGGFPEPFLKSDKRFYNRWKKLRMELLFREDLRDLTNIQEISQIEMLAETLRHQVGQLVNYSSLANDINVSVDTIRRWFKTLDYLYYCFIVRPWHKNIPKSLRKQPKVYLWDWSVIEDPGQRFENFIASHLKKTVDFWTDCGFGDYELYFIRDKVGKEVDFLISCDGKPWMFAEVKSSGSQALSPHLRYFQQMLKVDHAFQIIADESFIEQDCFTFGTPIRVPVLTLLSQLV